MPVFLSHKKEDSAAVIEIERFLRANGVSCYLDVTDSMLSSTDDITSTLMKRVRDCTHLMACVSSVTVTSWWVPFEIGVASGLERRVSSYKLSAVLLPDYLSKWPVLATRQHLEAFVARYRADTSVGILERKYASGTIGTAAEFHRLLKSDLGQR